MPERRPARASNRFVRAATFIAVIMLAASAAILLMPQHNYAQSTLPLTAPRLVPTDKFTKSDKRIAEKGAKLAAKAKQKAKPNAAKAGKQTKQPKTGAENARRGKKDSNQEGNPGRRKCPPGQKLDKLSRGGCLSL